MVKKLDPIENAGFQQACQNGTGQRDRRDVTSCYGLFRPTFVNGPFITTCEFKQIEFFDLTGFGEISKHKQIRLEARYPTSGRKLVGS
jgi:hypothetical protein